MSSGVDRRRALGYIRVSTSRQVDEGNGLGSQSARVREYARFRGLDLKSRDIMIDDGVSGGVPLKRRVSGGTLIERVESGRYGHVIAVKLDRMFRLTTDAIETIDHFHANGVAVHFIDFNGQSLDTSNPTGKFFLTMVAAFAEMERGLIAERTKEGMDYLKSNHLKFTRAIYGWDVNSEGELRPNWAEQDRIDLMHWQMRTNGMSAMSVARMMNKRGHLGKLGGEWTSGSVKRVVGNKYHRSRNRFRAPEKWGRRPWHRREPLGRSNTERVVVPPIKGVWDKDDL